MKIEFLGTGAADFPKEWCEGYRRTASALIDDTILIDPGPWVIDAITQMDIDPKRIKYVLNTHRHEDHFDESALTFLCSHGAEFIEVAAGDTITLDGYRIDALRANHTIPCVHFIIERDEKRMFYGLDGAWLLYEEINAIWKRGVDLAVFDATIGFIDGDWRIFEHNNLNMVLEMKKSLKDSVKRYVISHMAYTLHTDHKTLEEEMKKHDITVAYDGLVIEF